MSGKIDPGAGQPATVQSFDFSDRNPPVANWGGTDADGGEVGVEMNEARMTPPAPAVSPDAGLKY